MIRPLKEWEAAPRGYKFGEKTFYSEHHLGVDHIVPEGTPVYAPVNCSIIVSGNFPQGGNTVHVSFSDQQYEKLIMRCMHLTQGMQTGEYKEGEIIGYTGNTGKYSEGAHLHTDISKQSVILDKFDNFIDPEQFFSKKTAAPTNEMVAYKKEGEPAIYALIGDVLIPFAMPFEIYQKEFGNVQLIDLSATDFTKYRVSETVQITPKEITVKQDTSLSHSEQ